MPSHHVAELRRLHSPVNFGFSWNRSLAHDLGAVIATELRALWLAGATEASGARPHAGLDCWSPNSASACPCALARAPRLSLRASRLQSTSTATRAGAATARRPPRTPT